MIIKSSRWRLAAAASPFALALSFVAAPAAAQTTEPADPNAPNVTDLNEYHEYLRQHGWPEESHQALADAFNEWWGSTFSPTGHM